MFKFKILKTFSLRSKVHLNTVFRIIETELYQNTTECEQIWT
jgi:hypothetical protein